MSSLSSSFVVFTLAVSSSFSGSGQGAFFSSWFKESTTPQEVAISPCANWQKDAFALFLVRHMWAKTLNRVVMPTASLSSTASYCTYADSFRSKLKAVWPRLFDTTLPTSKQYTLLKLLGFYSKESQSMAAGARLYIDCIKRTDDEQLGLLKAFDLSPKFLPRFQATALHFWLSLCRMRAVGQPSDGKCRLELPTGNQSVSADKTVFSAQRSKLSRECTLLSNGAYDRFWREMSRRLYQEEKLNSRQVSKYSMELEKIFYGSLFLLDESARRAMEGDQGASLLEAIDKDWRSLAVDGPRKLALEQYIRTCLKELQRVPDEVVLQGTMWLRVMMPAKMDMAISLRRKINE